MNPQRHPFQPPSPPPGPQGYGHGAPQWGHAPQQGWGQSPQQGWGHAPDAWNANALAPHMASSYESQNAFVTKVFGWMTMGLGLTAIIAWFTASTGLVATIAPLMLPLILVQFGLVLGLSFALHKLSGPVAIGGFLLYAALNGLLLSAIFMIYTLGSIAQVLLMTTLTFGFMFVYGWTTKRDLTSMGSLLIMALFGIIVGGLLNVLLFKSGMMDLILNAVGILIFVGLTAYDAQKIKEMGAVGFPTLADEQRMSVIGALTLYLDFINLFLKLLRFFGDRR